MYKFKRSLVGLIGVLTLIAIATLIMPYIGRGASGSGNTAPTSQIQNVKVVNLATEPVPIQGSATVSGTVQAQQTGTWNVGINGTPTVGLDAGNNTVKIDSASPLSVRDVDNPARQPFQAFDSLVLPFGQIQASQLITTVPAGKVLIIEDVSALGLLGGDDKLLYAAIESGPALHYLQLNDQGTDASGRRVYVASQHVRLYFTEGMQVYFYAERNPATSQPGINFSVFGYFVDKP